MPTREDKPWFLGLSMEGTNCWQFIVDYYEKEIGVNLRPYPGKLHGRSGRKKLAVFLDEYLNESGLWEIVSDPLYPDIAMFDINGFVIHGGIILGDGSMLHMRVTGSRIEDYKSRTLFKESKFKSLTNIYRYKNLRKDSSQDGYQGK